MDESQDSLEFLWDRLLSRHADLILEGYDELQESERKAVIDHLNKMTLEPGWQPEQRISAQVALNVLGKSDVKDRE